MPGVGDVKVHAVWNEGLAPSSLIPDKGVESWYNETVDTLEEDVATWLTAVYTAAKNKLLTVGGVVKLVVMASDYKAPSPTLLEEIQTAIDPIQNAGEGLGVAPIGHVVSVVGVAAESVDIELHLTYAQGWDWESAKSYIEKVIDSYFQELARSWAGSDFLTVRISQIESRILSECSDMVTDIGGTKINGKESNHALSPDSMQYYVIEVNPRSSRTVPYISKVTGIPIVPLATKVILGHTIRELGYEPGLQREADYIAIKMPVFSFEKIRGADIALGPEMKSTGECLGIAKTFNEALYKAFLGAGVTLPKYKQMIMTVKDADKPEAVGVAKRFEALGYKIYATRSTAKYLQEHGVNALRVNKISQESPNVMDLILGHKIDLVIDTPTQGNGDKTRDGFLIRRNAIETGVYCITAMDTANALARSLETATDDLTPVDIATVKNL